MKHTRIGKKALSLILAFCMVLGLLPALSISASAAWDGSTADYTWYGDGSADTFYIGTAAELKGLANIANGQDGRESSDFSGKTIVLTSDIDLDSKEWTPIGTDYFGGSFNGNFHTISNLSITTVQTLVGLFGFTDGVIANLKVTGIITVSDNSACTNGSNGGYIGGIAAVCFGTILNCESKIMINVSGVNSSGTYVGELTGWCNAIYNSRADGAITIADSLSADSLYIGGLSGKSEGSSYFVNNCSTVTLPVSGGAGIGEAVGTDGNDDSDDPDSSIFLTIKNFYYNGEHEPCGVHNDNLALADVFYLTDEILKGGASDSDLHYSTDTSYYEKIPAGETNAVIKALNNGRTAISDMPDGYSAKDWISDADGYPTLNFTSAEDNTVPLVYGVSTSVVLGGTVNAACNKDGTLYLVPKPTSAYTQKSALVSAAAAGGMTMFCPAGLSRSFDTNGLGAGAYQIYAVDKLGQLSSPSSDITLYTDSVWDGTSASYGWYGTGRQSTFYLNTAADLKGFANIVNGEDNQSSKDFYGKTVILTRDIDLGNHEWTPIGVTYISFDGMFDGQGHTISNLHISSGGNAGLFGYITGTAIKNLNVSGNIAVTLTNHYVEYSQEGAFAGGLASCSCGCAIINCSTDVTMNVTVANIQGNKNNLCAFYIGGLVGCLTAPTNDKGNGIVNCYSRGSITVTANNNLGYLYAGGLVGGLSKEHNSSDVTACENCYAACPVTISGASVGTSPNRCLGAVIGGKVDECIADNCFWSTGLTSCGGIGSGVDYEGKNKALISTGNCSGLSDAVLKGTESGTISYTDSSGSVSTSAFLEALNGGRSAITCLSDNVKAKKWKYENGVNGGYPVFDDTAPTITAFSPAAGSGNVSTSPQLSVNFNEPVKGVSGKYLFVVKAEDGSVAGAVDLGSSQVSVSGNTATITLPISLENSTDYYIVMDDGSFESDAGVSCGGISGSSAWSFTTATANTYSVSGTVHDHADAPVLGAEVKLMQGGTQFGSTVTTTANGAFTVGGISNGEYNLVVTYGNRTITKFIQISGANCATGTITLPNDSRNSVLSVTGDDTPAVVVNGLDREAAAQTETSCTVTMTVMKKLAGDPDIQAEADDIVSIAGGQSLEYLKISVTKTSDDGIKTMNSLSTVQEIAVPYDFSGKNNIVVYRDHINSPAALTALGSRPSLSDAVDGTFYADSTDGKLYIYANKFSAYAIGYGTVSGSVLGDSSSGLGSYIIKASAGGGGSISPSGSTSVAYGGSKTYTVTPDSDYSISDVLVDGKSVGVVSSYTFTDIKQAHTIQAVFAKISALPYYLNDSGNKVFIGFASDKGGTMKYIAPNGKTVLFAQNPKSFTDISGHWAKSYIDFAAQREIFVGTGGSLFSPDTGMTRAMFATVIGRLFECSYGALATSGTHAFTDCNYSGWYGTYVDWCAENGIIEGIGGGLFEPDREITREEMAVILYRFAGFLKVSEAADGTALSYPDASDIDAWAENAALYCQQTGIITGRESGSFAPKETATRAEVATILKRFVETVV